jgi:acetyl-CoA carboxylase biotin carboxyl carrier protein
MDLNEIQSLIKFVSKSGANEVELETKDFKITIKSGPKGKRGKQAEEPQQVVHTQMPMAAMPQQMPMPQQPMPQQQQAAPQQQSEPAQQSQGSDQKKDDKAEDDYKYVTIKSPMIGTFYRSASPDKPPYVEVGDSIKEGDVTCIIEAMKLFNEIESEVNGKIVKVLVDDATPVEYDQPLFLVDPS